MKNPISSKIECPELKWRNSSLFCFLLIEVIFVPFQSKKKSTLALHARLCFYPLLERLWFLVSQEASVRRPPPYRNVWPKIWRYTCKFVGSRSRDDISYLKCGAQEEVKLPLLTCLVSRSKHMFDVTSVGKPNATTLHCHQNLAKVSLKKLIKRTHTSKISTRLYVYTL